MSTATTAGCRHQQILRELSAADASTLLQLQAHERAARAGAIVRRPVVEDLSARPRRQMTSIADRLERLAADQIADPAELRKMAVWLRTHLPATPEPPELPSPIEAGPHPREILCAWLQRARDRGYTLESMAEVMGVTRERVRQLAGQGSYLEGIPAVVGKTLEPKLLPWPIVVEKSWLRWPRPTLNPEETAELVELHNLGRQLRGAVSADDPRRMASEEVARRIHVLLTERGFTTREVADLLALTAGAIRMKMAQHGYRTLPPSQKKYQGAPPDRSPCGGKSDAER